MTVPRVYATFEDADSLRPLDFHPPCLLCSFVSPTFETLNCLLDCFLTCFWLCKALSDRVNTKPSFALFDFSAFEPAFCNVMAQVKLATLVIRTIAKPLSSVIKERSKNHETFRNYTISLAQGLHRLEVHINHLHIEAYPW
jgi:hypothetical protein